LVDFDFFLVDVQRSCAAVRELCSCFWWLADSMGPNVPYVLWCKFFEEKKILHEHSCLCHNSQMFLSVVDLSAFALIDFSFNRSILFISKDNLIALGVVVAGIVVFLDSSV
jgi:hypothetical protein